MRFQFADTTRPSRVAKILRGELAARGIGLSLTQTQDLVARMHGYADFQELRALAGRRTPTPYDELCSPEEVESRRQRYARTLVQAGLSQADALAVVDAIRPTSRRVNPRNGGQASDALPFQPAFGHRSLMDLLQVAVGLKADTIHIQATPDGTTIRMGGRTGELDAGHATSEQGHALCLEAFNRSRVSDASYRVQDVQWARIQVEPDDGDIPVLLSAIDLYFLPLPGEGRQLKMVLRSGRRARFESPYPHMTPPQEEAMARLLGRRGSLALVAGPTNGGKTTLQSLAMRHARRLFPKAPISTVENPPEHSIGGGVRQVAVGEWGIGLPLTPFGLAVQEATLDGPEILMIGEVRDTESARTALAHAMDGRNVWSGLHGGEPASALERFRGLTGQRTDFPARELLGGFVQTRVAPTLCLACRVPFGTAVERGIVSAGLRASLVAAFGEDQVGRAHFASPDGCPHCSGQRGGRAGHAGMTQVTEVIELDEDVRDLLLAGREQEAYVRLEARPGFVTLLEHAMLKVADGILDPRQVEDRVGSVSEIDAHRFRRLLAEHT